MLFRMLGLYITAFIEERTVKRNTKRKSAKARLVKIRMVLRLFLKIFL